MFVLPLANILDFPLQDMSWPTPWLFASCRQHCLGVLGIVASRNLHPVQDASFALSLFCPPSTFESVCLPIVQHPRDTSALHSLFASCHWHHLALLALLLVRICIPFRMLLLHHHTSACLPLNLLIVQQPHLPVSITFVLLSAPWTFPLATFTWWLYFPACIGDTITKYIRYGDPSLVI
jgi:hypothetical protein